MSTKPTPPVVSGAKPGLGHVLEFMQDRSAVIQRGYEEHGRIFTVKMASRNVAVVIGPDFHRIYFTETDDKLNISTPYNFLKATFGEALFIAPHEQYLRQRPLVMQAFRREKMMSYVEVMEREVQKWLDSLGDEGEMDIAGEMSRLTQEVAGYALMGEKFQQEAGREFWDHYTTLGLALDPILPPNLPLPKFIRRDRARDRMKAIMQPMLDDRRRNPDAYEDFLQDFVNSRYADTGEPVEDEVLLNLMLALMFAGHETTAGQAAWNIILMLQNPDYLAQVQEEIDRVLPPGTPIDGKSMRGMTLLSYAVTETERMRPSVDTLMRTVDKDIEFGDYVVPAGWMVQVAQEIAHNLPDVFTQPEVYDPLRFSPERAEDKTDRFNLIGFGGGTHKCTGMNFANNEQMIIAALLLQQFDLELITKNPGINRGLGASRPETTWIHYERKTAPVVEESAESIVAVPA